MPLKRHKISNQAYKNEPKLFRPNKAFEQKHNRKTKDNITSGPLTLQITGVKQKHLHLRSKLLAAQENSSQVIRQNISRQTKILQITFCRKKITIS